MQKMLLFMMILIAHTIDAYSPRLVKDMVYVFDKVIIDEH